MKLAKKVCITSVSSLMFCGLASSAVGQTEADAALPDAKPGECYAKVIIPATFKTEEEIVVLSEASSKIEVIPAKYEMVEEQLLVKEASQQLVPVPAVYENAATEILVRSGETFWTIGSKADARRANPSLLAGAGANGLPIANATPGQCYTEYYVPPQYKTETEQIMVQEASFQIKVVPARYEQAEEQVMVKEASSRLVEVPAEYTTVSEQIMVTAATTEWKKGRGPIEKIDNGTGEILCLVEVPAVYKTVQKRVIKTPASTKTVEIPAEFKVQRVNKLAEPARGERMEIPAKFETVTKRTKISDDKTHWTLSTEEASQGKATGRTVCLRETQPVYQTVKQRKLKTPATTQVKEIPAQYKTVKMRKLVSPASERRTEIPAKTEVVTRKIKVTEEILEWKPVLCETNMSQSLVSDIQRALQKAGHYEGPIDGIIGKQTMAAVDSYQRKKGMARGGLTMAALKELGVNP